MEGTFFNMTEWKTMPWLRTWDTLFWGPYQSVLDTIMTQWGNGDKADLPAVKNYYINHYARVRGRVSTKRWLEFESKEGWAPL